MTAYDGPFYRLRSPVTRIASLRIPVDVAGRLVGPLPAGRAACCTRRWSTRPTRCGSRRRTTTRRPIHPCGRRWGSAPRSRWACGGSPTGSRARATGSRSLPPPQPIHDGGPAAGSTPRPGRLPNTRYTPYYLAGGRSGSAQSLNDGTLSTTKPAAPGGDTEPLLPASSPCSRMTAQWTAGIAARLLRNRHVHLRGELAHLHHASAEAATPR